VSTVPPTGPPTGPVDGPPGFGTAPVPPTEPPPRRSVWPILAGVVLGLALVLGGLGLGFLLFGGDDEDEPEAAASTTVVEEDEPAVEDPFGDFSDPFGGDLSDFSDLLPEGFEDDFSDLLPEGFEDLLPEDFDELDEFLEEPPFGFDDVQATVLFTPSATPAQVRRVEQAWEDEPLLSGVISLDTEELDDLTGGSLPPGMVPPTITAFGAEEDAAQVREFVCSFADDPGVQLVQTLGTEACDESL